MGGLLPGLPSSFKLDHKRMQWWNELAPMPQYMGG